MSRDIRTDAEVLASWQRNAAPWIAAVRGGEIASRRLVTDAAVLDAVLACAPRSVIDLGCGEGWLALALARRGVAVTGVDAVPELVEAARAAGLADCRLLTYEQVAQGALPCRADAVVCNFSLIGATCVDDLLHAVPALLEPQGTLVVQTLHPLMACGDESYIDGWRAGSWAGFSRAFRDAPPWYFRTLESWTALLDMSGFDLRALREPLDPRSGKPASVLFMAQRRA
ncbi:class I SAM-dependent methyltransferase [Paraburkholderia silvatlantica]|uniref:Methyltransferase family protein n=1 Tax=Paraburkholderia silvatlantica TaxID=321895 RepID=A0A2V4U0D7_9BURK|nr:methyltransferase domain-containing protein [Paraburkholderia silvatlantica]PYE12889.1 methyltransferase family protein [Paraburkholderia silvatlantica]TDQ75526.1 methyltransferase family protein [Paraburkholderia silvatlantica]